MKIKLWLSIGLMIGTLALAVLSWLLLPETVSIQLSPSYQAPRTLSKLVAIGLPTAFSIGLSTLGLLTKSTRYRFYLTLACLCLITFVLLLIINK